MQGQDNPTFVGDNFYTVSGKYRNKNLTEFYPGKYQQKAFPSEAPKQPTTTQLQIQNEKEIESQKKPPKERDSWGKGIEFLLSCIAMSVGLGNIWRFPFVALENGGGKKLSSTLNLPGGELELTGIEPKSILLSDFYLTQIKICLFKKF